MENVEKFRTAIVGIGTRSAEKMLIRMLSCDTTELVAICDQDNELLKQICEKYGINGYRSYEELIENEEIDFAVITIKHGTRTPEPKGKRKTAKEFLHNTRLV